MAFSELNDYYMEPGSEYNDEGLVKSKRFKILMAEGSKAIKLSQRMSGASTLYLSDESNNALQKLFMKSWEADNFSSHYADHIKTMYSSVSECYKRIREEAMSSLNLT